MGYWMHVYSQTDEVMEFETVEQLLASDPEADEEGGIVVELCAGRRGAAWKQLQLSHRDGTLIALVELIRGKGVAPRVAEAIEAVLETEPRQNAEWVADFLRGVKVIYQFQILSGVDVDGGWEAVHELIEELCEGFDGILHAESEGFSNQVGYHITWEFSDATSGEWEMGLYDAKADRWTTFQMELSNRAHREAFCSGRVPRGVKRR
jgi:hypothetical protein